jgi:hypothetical protein
VDDMTRKLLDKDSIVEDLNFKLESNTQKLSKAKTGLQGSLQALKDKDC